MRPGLLSRLLPGLLLLSFPLVSAEVDFSWTVLQSDQGPVLHDHGIHGQGEIIATADTGVDADSCFFAEEDGTLPPVNVGSPEGGLHWENVDRTRRKIIAYDFLFSCAEYPGAAGCDDPESPAAWDNLGHGTRVAGLAAGDRGRPLIHESGDGVAPAAQLIVQDVGFVATSPCQAPGFGCPATDVTRILEQARKQGATIHSHQWGDRMSSYSDLARQIDAFVVEHPEAVVVFNAGNAGQAGASSVSSPGVAKNAIQVGGTRNGSYDDTVIAPYSGRGPSRDGRIKPDLVAPAFVPAAAGDGNVESGNCNLFTAVAGTSWSAPLVAGAAALARHYFRDGFYPSGAANPADRMEPSAALIKATLIASARAVPRIATTSGDQLAEAVPSYEQGFGFPVLDRALHFAGESRKLRVLDRGTAGGLSTGEIVEFRLTVDSGEPLEVALVWTDPAVAKASGSPALVNDLDLELAGPEGTVHFGNAALNGGVPDRVNNVEKVVVAAPAEGEWVVRIRASEVVEGIQGFALVAAGAIEVPNQPSRRRAVRR